MPYAPHMADLLGIDRRINKNNKQYQDIKMGNIPDIDFENAPVRLQALFGKVKHKEKGVETTEYSRMYDRSKYLFMLDAPFDISKQCCNVMKKNPAHAYGKETGRYPMTAQMAEESRLRTQKWTQNGCNGFDLKSPISNPMAFWTEQDVLLYIKINNIPICSVYGDIVADAKEEIEGQMSIEDYMSASELEEFELNKPLLKTTGCERTGCVCCGFGCQVKKDRRFLELKETHPKLYGLLDVVKNNGVTYREAIEWVNEHGNLNIKL